MKKVTVHYQNFLSRKESLTSFASAIVLFIGSFFVNYFASQYAFESKGNWVPDILLDNLPVVRMEAAFVTMTTLFVVFIAILLISRPHKISFVLKAMALFIITRAFFITLTHIGPSPFNTLDAPSHIGKAFTSGADLFFSGHTGMPFLFALMYWYNRNLRIIFFIVSILAAAGVLLGHIHYSIDVASAYFITYGIFIIASRVFKKDYEEFKRS